ASAASAPASPTTWASARPYRRWPSWRSAGRRARGVRRSSSVRPRSSGTGRRRRSASRPPCPCSSITARGARGPPSPRTPPAARDAGASARLKRITGPFILRRLKTDRSVIADLPAKMEMKVFCTLTREQASLYQAVMSETLEALKGAPKDDIQRKGVVLAALSKLKQVCNHPAQFLGDNSPLPGRSGKLARLTEMMEEVIAAG